MRGSTRSGKVAWTPERVAEAVKVWDELGTSVAAAEVLSVRWGLPVSAASVRNVGTIAKRAGTPPPAIPEWHPPAAQKPPEAPPHPAISPKPMAGLVAVIADLHVPDVDHGCLAAFERWCAAARPVEIIIAGDFLEMESASEHPGAKPRTVEQDLADGVAVMQRIQRLAPRVTLREGNHSTRASRIVQHRVPSMASRFRGPLEDFAAMGVDVETHTHSPTRRGNLLVLHGDEGFRGGNGGGLHSRKILEMYAEPGATIVYGHWHRTQHFVRPMELGNCEAYSLACMRQLNASWLGAELSGWNQGWGAVWLEPGRRATVDVVRYDGGKAQWGGRVY